MFFTNSLNIIDIIAIVPYFVTLFVEILALVEEQKIRELQDLEGSGATDVGILNHYSDKVAFLAVMRIIRLLRIIRLAKLSRHSRNLNALVKDTVEIAHSLFERKAVFTLLDPLQYCYQ